METRRKRVGLREPTAKGSNKKKKIRNGKAQDVFCIISLTFIIGCCIFYGSRLIKYYKIYNPKGEDGVAIEMLSSNIIKDSPVVYEGEGLYLNGGNYIYKGSNVSNYIVYSNQVWRIVQINSDRSIDIVLDDYVNVLKWGDKVSDYTASDISKYLNEKFAGILNKSILNTANLCLDEITDVKNITCDKTIKSGYVKLLDIRGYLNSFADDKSYISNTPIWLQNHSDEGIWITNKGNLSISTADNTCAVRPVVTLKNTITKISGTGTKDDPFIIEEKSSTIYNGAYVKLDKDLWIVYEINDAYLRLASANLYNSGSTTYRFDTISSTYDTKNTYSLANYLNTKYYDSLSYKGMLIEGTWYTGSYAESYSSIYESSVKSKVGILNAADIKYNSGLKNYYLSTPDTETTAYIYNENLISSKIKLSRPIRPAICINIPTVVSGTGSVSDPFVLEVK